jgi:hypothetical protein
MKRLEAKGLNVPNCLEAGRGPLTDKKGEMLVEEGAEGRCHAPSLVMQKHKGTVYPSIAIKSFSTCCGQLGWSFIFNTISSLYEDRFRTMH